MASSSRQPQGRDKTGKVEVTILASEWGSSKSGLSTLNKELAIQLAKFPFVKVTLFLPKCSHENKEEAQHHGISIVEADRQPGYEELDWLSFPPEDLQIDVVVGHGVKLGRQAPIIRKYHKCKWVQVVHTDPEELGMFKSNDNPISKAEQKHHVEVELCQMADLVVAIGSKLTEAFRNYLGSCKNDVFEFTPGIFPDFATVKPVPAKQKHRSVLVSGCGDAEDFELKGFDIAARSVAALPDSHLVFGGAPEGKHEEITERFLGLGIAANRLRVEGYLDWDALKELFCEVDLMLMPSRTEGFCVTGLEALSAGLPVIVSKNAWFGEALGSIPFGSSFVIDSEDPSAWTAAIKGIWNKDRQVRLDESKILRDCYGKKYSWSEQCKNLLEKVVNLIENKAVTNKEIKKKKEKQYIKEMEKRSSEEEMDMTEACTDKPVQEQPEGHLVHQSPTGGTMRKPCVDIVSSAPAPAPEISQFQQQTIIEPCAREKKNVQIKDQNSDKDVTQEILKQKPAGRSAFTAAGTPTVTPNLSGQSSNSSTPPLTSQQQAEADVWAGFAVQVAATLKDSEEKPKKIENAVQKSNANTRADADSSKAKEPIIAQKQEALNGLKNNDVVTNATEKASETNLKEATVTATSQSKEDESSNSGESVLAPKSLVSSADATNLANKKITNVRVEIFTAQEVPKRESTKSSAPVVTEMIKPHESEKPVATDALPVSESKTLNGPTTTVFDEQAGEETEKVTTIISEVEVETAPDAAAAAVAPEPSKAPEDDDVTTQNEETTQGSEEPEALPPSSQVEEASGMEKVNGHDGERKASQTASKIDLPVPVATKEMKKKKQKQKEIEKRSSEKEMDMMEAYTDKPVQEQVPDEAEEEPVEDTTQTQQKETIEDAPSDHETWKDKEDSWSPDLEDASDTQPDGANGSDLLLQFQTNPSSLKPVGLPDIDVDLVHAPSKSGSQQNRMPKGDCGESMFLPSYMRQISKALFCKVRAILGKLTPQNFRALTQQMIDLDIDTQERLEGFTDLIYAKAIEEATPLVAKMCQFLVSENKKVVVEKDGMKKHISFRKILLNRCQKEFEKENSLEETTDEKLADLVNQGLNEEELQKRKIDLQDQVRQAKRRTLGNIQFIGELFKLKMLTERIMHDCVVKLLRRNDEESFECLCKLLVTIGKDLDHEKGKVTLLTTLFPFVFNKLISVLLSQCSPFQAVTSKSYRLNITYYYLK